MRIGPRNGSGGFPNARSGFTLLEVVIALAIFAAGILAVLDLLAGSLRLSEGSRDVSAAQVYASQRMEEALLAPNPAPGIEQGSFGEKYRWETRTTEEPTEGEFPFREVRIRVFVRWDDGGAERSVDLSASRWTRRLPGETD